MVVASTDRLVFANPRRGKGEPKEITVRGVVTGTFEDSLFFRSLEDVEVGDWEFEANGFTELERGDWLRWERPIGGDSQDALLWFYAAEEGFDYEREEVEEGDEDAVAEWFAFQESHLHMLAPLLEGEAARTQPEWLFRFLKDPFDMRLHLDLRMANFSMSDTKAHDLAEYFSARDDVDYPFLTKPERSDNYRQSRRAEIQMRARYIFVQLRLPPGDAAVDLVYQLFKRLLPGPLFRAPADPRAHRNPASPEHLGQCLHRHAVSFHPDHSQQLPHANGFRLSASARELSHLKLQLVEGKLDVPVCTEKWALEPGRAAVHIDIRAAVYRLDLPIVIGRPPREAIHPVSNPGRGSRTLHRPHIGRSRGSQGRTESQ